MPLRAQSRLSRLLLVPLRRAFPSPQQTRHHSVSAHELSHFSNLASSWWDPMGPSRALHLMNPLRHDFISSCLSDSGTASQDQGHDYLDIGCGGGIFAESIARTIPAGRARSVTALDPSDTLIGIAREHARCDPVVADLLAEGRFRYLNRSVEEHGSLLGLSPSSPAAGTESAAEAEGKNKGYDIITLFEVLEHIDPASSSPLSFLSSCLRLLRPGGWLVGSTIARSIPSFIVNQVIAEAPWPVGVVPRGTHEWGKFVNPDEVKAWALRGLADGEAARHGDMWKCVGVMYFPGLGWKMVDGSECWGNYFWGVRKGL
ncbi:hexaprenyldihydroxybenzoate methyltransferase [Aspergillus sp. HF37]|nr:hexaprenyldihydroxybenzoate methyltransferase [Aspergillus sp. HF37]